MSRGRGKYVFSRKDKTQRRNQGQRGNSTKRHRAQQERRAHGNGPNQQSRDRSSDHQPNR